MPKKLLVKVLIVSSFSFITFQSLPTQAGMFHPKPGSTVLADSIVAAIDRGDSIIFFDCKILGPLIREGSIERTDTIKSFIDIFQSTFLDTVSFKNYCFKENVRFGEDSFSTDAKFYRATFGEDVDFKDATFGRNANFGIATFSQNATFWNTTFSGYANFTNAIFGGDAIFWKATFGGDASFWDATFDSLAYFRDATFGGDADFTNTEFLKEVDLSPKEFKNIDISWKQLQGHLVYNETGNYKLMKYFEEQRKLKDADGIFLFLKDQERMEKHPLIRYPEYWFVYLTCGYGRRPLYTFILSVLVVILFAVFFAKPRAIKEIESTASGKRFYNALYFSIHTFIIGIVSNWHPTDEFLIDRTIRIKLFKFRINKEIKCFKYRTLSMIEGALGWILIIILIISLERTIGR
jgi:hypothetical protein